MTENFVGLPATRRLLQVDGALQRRFRRERVLRRHAVEQADVFLLPGDARAGYGIQARTVSPGRHRIGVDDERLGDAHAARRDAALAARQRLRAATSSW